MAEIVLFHHIMGLTGGVHALAEDFRAAGHAVHTPDLFEGALPASIDAGMALREQVGDAEFSDRANRAVDGLPDNLVFAGMSFGVIQAQRLAQTREGARGALLFESCIPITGEWAFGPWPADVPVQIHGMDKDPSFAGEGDIDAAQELVAHVGAPTAELFTYDGSSHQFMDRSLPAYDAPAATLAIRRSLELLERIDAAASRAH